MRHAHHELVQSDQIDRLDQAVRLSRQDLLAASASTLAEEAPASDAVAGSAYAPQFHLVVERRAGRQAVAVLPQPVRLAPQGAPEAVSVSA